MKRKWKAHKS